MAHLLLLASLVVNQSPIVKHIDAVSLNVMHGENYASAVTYPRQIEKKNVVFLWGCAHLFLHKTDKITFDGDKLANLRKIKLGGVVAGRRFGEKLKSFSPKVIGFSEPTGGLDICLMYGLSNDFKEGAKFGKCKSILGGEIYHSGNMTDEFGESNLSAGIFSKTDFVSHAGNRYDGANITILPGSSGGGIFDKQSGEYLGFLSRSKGENLGLVVPLRNIRSFAQKNKLEWALDNTIPPPTLKELSKLEINEYTIEESIMNLFLNPKLLKGR